MSPLFRQNQRKTWRHSRSSQHPRIPKLHFPHRELARNGFPLTASRHPQSQPNKNLTSRLLQRLSMTQMQWTGRRLKKHKFYNQTLLGVCLFMKPQDRRHSKANYPQHQNHRPGSCETPLLNLYPGLRNINPIPSTVPRFFNRTMLVGEANPPLQWII